MSLPPSLAPFVDERYGIVRRCLDLPLRPDDPRVFMTVAEGCRSERFAHGSPPTPRFGCGVAMTAEGAAGAAVGEVLERYAASFCPPDQIRHATHEELERDGEGAVEPERFALYAPEQYRRFPDENWPRGLHPVPLTRSTPTGWVRAVGLVDRRPALLPATFVYLPYRYPDGEPFLTNGFTTGLACGTDPVRTTLHALLEVVERDVVALSWLDRRRPTRLRFADGDELPAGDCRQRLRCPGARWIFLDLTADLGVPTVMAVLEDEAGGVSVGTAARPDPAEAIRKAALEAIQCRLVWRRELAAGEGPPLEASGVTAFGDHAAYYVDPRRADVVREFFADAPERTVALPSGTVDPSRALRDLSRRLEAAGHAPFAVDVTTRDLRRHGLCVIRAVAPGLQPLHARHTAPFLGGDRLTSPTDRLHPEPHPFP